MEHNTERRSNFMPGIIQKMGWIIGGIVLAVFLAFIFGYFVMLLWNWIMPTLFGLPTIDYWMAFGIIILSRLIFGGFGHGHHQKNNHHDRFYGSKFRNRCRTQFDPQNRWRHYEDYWKEEGEEAFAAYIEKKKADGNL
jgi:hypothetical protein